LRLSKCPAKVTYLDRGMLAAMIWLEAADRYGLPHCFQFSDPFRRNLQMT
jgi:hypothetical protein